MITRETINKIVEAAQIEEVVGDFVRLKKRGTSLIGNCPFHEEKTPSFHVSAAKGIYKCFGCGKGGDAVSFIMEHEKYSYPEALKYLANKFNIEIEENQQSKQEQKALNTNESLLAVSVFAAHYFEDQLWNSEAGKAIGLSYFKERGFRDGTIKKFNLGYSSDIWDALTQEALKNGYDPHFLEITGLSLKNDKGYLYDRFRSRVIFPVHNFTGRIIGFGGRTLKTDKNIPKYINSPESDIYHKSNVLYGLYHAKKAIREANNCYLVEGYTDVLSAHQAYIENVVASSGTSLTSEQIKLIGRFTKNITILYDSDKAGVKASLRGLDMILEEGLNVKIVSFPDGHDPDSYMRHVGAGEFKTYIENNRQDFILYKANILLADAGKDPIKKAGIIRYIVESIAKIPDQITAWVFVKECSRLLEVEERVLLGELNAVRVNRLKKAVSSQKTSFNHAKEELPAEKALSDDFDRQTEKPNTDDLQEQEIVRLLLNYGHELINWDKIDNLYIGSFIIQNLNDVQFENPLCKQIIDCYRNEIENGHLPTANQFIKNDDSAIANLAINLSTSPYHLSENWFNMHQIYVPDETVNLKATILGGLYHLKKRKVDRMLANLLIEIKAESDPANQHILMNKYTLIKNVERDISKFLGSVILK